jgi:hypothetical protein
MSFGKPRRGIARGKGDRKIGRRGDGETFKNSEFGLLNAESKIRRSTLASSRLSFLDLYFIARKAIE